MARTPRITTTRVPKERRRRAWARRLSLVLVAPSMLALASASPTEAALPPECVTAANGIDAICTYIGPAGAQWAVQAPAGATSMRIRAVGQAGQQSDTGVPGGAGRWVEQTLTTTPGTPFTVTMVNDGGVGPGGAGDGGGSAAVHRAGTLLVQAAGGGGAGASAAGNTQGGQGGNAHVAGANGGGNDPAEGGRPGTSSAHGLGGAGGCFPFIGCADAGDPGTQIRGGSGGTDSSAGGGGGGGLAKGGGGGSGFFDAGLSGGGGGGGFSFPTNAPSGLASPAETRRVVITFFRTRATFSSTHVDFGDVFVGTTSPQQTLTVRNTGTAPLTISSVTLSQSQAAFQKSAGCVGVTLAPNGGCTIALTFSPPSMGSFQATLVVGSDTMEGGDSVVTLHGTGVQPIATLTPPSLSFPDTLVGDQSPSQRVTMKNTGTGNMTIQSVQLAGSNPSSFVEINDNCSFRILTPNSSCFVDVAFRPGSEGTKTAKLSFLDNAPGTPHETSLSGLGTLAVADVSPDQIDFGDVGVGTSSASQLATIENTGTGPLQVFNVTLDGVNAGDFVIGAHNCVGTIPAGTSCSIPVHFDPQRRGARTAVLRVEDSAAGSPRDVALGGNGVALGDLQVRGPGSVFTGGQGSLVTLAVAPAGTASYGVKVINTTAAARSYEIALTQDGAAATATLHNGFLQLPKNAAGNYVTAVLQPGKSIIYTLKVKPTAPGQVTSGVDVHLVAANGAEHDFVTTETNVRAPAKGTDSFGVFVRAGSQQYVGGSVDGQTTTSNSVALNASTTFNAMLRNDGAAATAMTFRMSAPANPCWTTKVTVKQGLATVDITGQATGSGYLTKVLPVNGSLIVTITMKRVASNCAALSWQVATYDGPTLKHYSHLLANPAV